MANIRDEAKKLYDSVLEAYYANPDLTFTQILNEHLTKYNDTVSENLKKSLFDIMNAEMSISSIAMPITVERLSSVLYKNAETTARSAQKVINEHLTTGTTINELREALYDGYGYDELLPIKKKLPKYVRESLTEEKIARLKTKPLKAAYLKILDAKNERQLKKAMRVALEEKARYYAHRIARTEEHRSFILSTTSEYLQEGVEYVRWTMSSLHRTTCICEFYANQDIGYGKGVYPINYAPAPVYSTHPNCMCYFRAVYREPKFNYRPVEVYEDADKFNEVLVKDLFI